MTPARKPPTGPPPSAGVLAKYAQAYAREVGVSEGRVRAWIAYMIMAGVLERAAVGGDPRFTVKGGAQKLHGMTLPPRPGKCNDRFRDLIDLLLMEEPVTDYSGLREACEAVFRTRGTHDWPPALDVPPHWIEPFARLAQELDLPVADAHAGLAQVQAFVNRMIAE